MNRYKVLTTRGTDMIKYVASAVWNNGKRCWR